ncbi:MAG: hypothetical protein KDN22_21630 [Verrucomicrobiae bacterium]|nr:hypothetical protein [Verrucomicrobiae bacterium]
MTAEEYFEKIKEFVSSDMNLRLQEFRKFLNERFLPTSPHKKKFNLTGKVGDAWKSNVCERIKKHPEFAPHVQAELKRAIGQWFKENRKEPHFPSFLDVPINIEGYSTRSVENTVPMLYDDAAIKEATALYRDLAVEISTGGEQHQTSPEIIELLYRFLRKKMSEHNKKLILSPLSAKQMEVA